MERRLIASHHLPDIEILVAGHHGSKSSTGLELLMALRPEAVAVSVGQNAYGHPSPEMLDRAVRAGCRIFGPINPEPWCSEGKETMARQTTSAAPLQALKQAIQEGSPKPCYIFWGEETYLLQHYLELLEKTDRPGDRGI